MDVGSSDINNNVDFSVANSSHIFVKVGIFYPNEVKMMLFMFFEIILFN